MARKSIAGQLNMFDFFNQDAPAGEVEMVSLMPNFDEEEPEPVMIDVPSEPEGKEEQKVVIEERTSEPVVEEKMEPVIDVTEVVKEEISEPENDAKEHRPERKESSSHRVGTENAVMSRVYEIDGEKLEIAYINYNKVRITRGSKEPEIKVFDSSKEAVDYYVEKMQELEVDE